MPHCRWCGLFNLRDIADAFVIEPYTTAASAIGRDEAAQDAKIALELAALKRKMRNMRNA